MACWLAVALALLSLATLVSGLPTRLWGAAPDLPTFQPPVVDSERVYIATSVGGSCTAAAFNASNGAEVWRKNATCSGQVSQIRVYGNVAFVYEVTTFVNGLYALSAQTGDVLWHQFDVNLYLDDFVVSSGRLVSFQWNGPRRTAFNLVARSIDTGNVVSKLAVSRPGFIGPSALKPLLGMLVVGDYCNVIAFDETGSLLLWNVSVVDGQGTNCTGFDLGPETILAAGSSSIVASYRRGQGFHRPAWVAVLTNVTQDGATVSTFKQSDSGVVKAVDSGLGRNILFGQKFNNSGALVNLTVSSVSLNLGVTAWTQLYNPYDSIVAAVVDDTAGLVLVTYGAIQHTTIQNNVMVDAINASTGDVAWSININGAANAICHEYSCQPRGLALSGSTLFVALSLPVGYGSNLQAFDVGGDSSA